MKLIGYLQAAAASRQVLEEYMPSKLPLPADVVAAIRERYDFQNFPEVLPGSEVPTAMQFALGRYGTGDEAFGVGALIMEPAGDVVQAVTTDQADAVLDDLAAFMTERFGFRLTEAPARRSYTSNLVVEFDDYFDSYIGKLSEIAAVLNRVKLGPGEVSLKRIGFGTTPVPTLDHVSQVEQSDFLFESRVSIPIVPKRYYCSAPIRTRDHINMLEEIEKVLKN